MVITALQTRAQSAKDVLRHAVLELQRAHIDTASMDARILLQHVLGLSREQLLGNPERMLSYRQHAAYRDLVAKRLARQPVSQLIGKREFWGLNFKVTQDTLDPRPDSETLIEAVLPHFQDRSAPLRILDLGTGTGCLLLSLLTEYPRATGLAVDISPRALQVAQENALNLGLSARVDFTLSCWGNEVKDMFDIIIANPPYIPSGDIEALAPEVSHWEPKLALDGGTDGLECYRAIVPQLHRLLKPGGVAAFEIGLGQSRALHDLAENSGLEAAGVKDDMACIARCVLVRQRINLGE